VNLLLHIIVVPMFLLANLALIVALVERSWWSALVAVVVMLVSLGLQGRGHRQEGIQPEPFMGPLNAVSRIFLEQWVTFPRFVLSGGWIRAFRAAP
jgi:hypothetical protein